MKILKVTYTVKATFTAQNQLNIKQVMSDLKQAHQEGINYTVCLAEDNKTFIHTAFFKSTEDQKLLNALPSFKRFQEQLSGGLEVPPKQELLTLVGSTRDIF